MQTIYTFSYTPAIATGTNTIGVNWRMAYQQPIMLYKGTANTIKIVVFATNQRVVNLTGYEIQVQIVDKETEEHYVTRTATITSPTSGVGTITFTEAELRNLENRFYHIIARLVLPGDGSSVTTSEILYLDDNYGAFLPIQIENAWNYQPTIISTENGAQVINFRSIGETPDSYTGHARKLLQVNNAENAVEFTNSIDISSLDVGNITISNSTIDTNLLNLSFNFGTQKISFVDNSTDPDHNFGDGGFITFNDNTHTNDGPRFEIWYGNIAEPADPSGQHSLDIRAAANSYVELASYDLNSFIGVDDIGPFIQTQWQSEPTKAWRFLGDGELRLPNVNSSITSLDGRLSLVLAFDDIRFNRLDIDGSTLHSTIFDTNGDVYIDGDLLPGSFDPDPTPLHSLGSPTHPWKDLHVSNSTIYLGNVALSVDNTGNLLVDGNVITGGGGPNTPIQPYVELTNNPFIIQPVVLGEPVTVTAPVSGQGATFDVIIGAGPLLLLVAVNSPGTGYVVGQRYKIWYYNIGGNTSTSYNIYFEIETVGELGEILSIANPQFSGLTGDNVPGNYSGVSIEMYSSVVDEISPGVTLTRGRVQGLYNIVSEQEYNTNTYVSPLNTEWNADGWDNLVGIGNRSFTTFRSALGGQVGNNIIGTELVMRDITTDRYYKFEFTDWGQNNGGSYSYTRTEITDPNFFRKTDDGDEIDIFVADDSSGAGIGITRGGQQGIYNPYRDEGWTSNVSPSGTQWNIDGWDDLSNIETRTYTNFYAAYGNGGLGNKVPGSKAVMYIPETGTYYAIQWLSWTQNANGGGFSYVRYELDLTQLNEGVKFSDGTVLKSAEGLGRVKSTASAGRRIEEVVGNKTVSVTERITTNYTSTSERTTNTNYEIFVTRTVELDAILDPIFNNGVNGFIEISFDNITYREAWLSSIQSTEYWFYYRNNNSYVPQTQGDTVYIRISTGADPVVWWNKNDLPSGSSNFRGAVIDYHAYTGEGTFIGTIHIVDDDGEEHISHTEVASGSTDSENDDLWVVQNEGTISYRRIDGEAKTLKIHWTAKVFYGEELYD